MTLPGAETMNGGIMGVDCLRKSAGAPVAREVPVADMLESSCAGIESIGDCSGVWVECDDVLRGFRDSMGYD
jgi:hypothetical protein